MSQTENILEKVRAQINTTFPTSPEPERSVRVLAEATKELLRHSYKPIFLINADDAAYIRNYLSKSTGEILQLLVDVEIYYSSSASTFMGFTSAKNHLITAEVKLARAFKENAGGRGKSSLRIKDFFSRLSQKIKQELLNELDNSIDAVDSVQLLSDYRTELHEAFKLLENITKKF